MRIPPAVAREIGQMYAAARVNEFAVHRLEDVSTLLTRAAGKATNGLVDAAVVDARDAATLLANVANHEDSALSLQTREHARSAAAPLDAALGAFTLGLVQEAATQLTAADVLVDAAGTAARDHAAGLRQAADELAAEYM